MVWHLLTICWVLARCDALFLLERLGINGRWLRALRLVRKRSSGGTLRPGERLAVAFRQLGPSFIKLGQVFSTRADLIGEDIAQDLAGLRDNVEPFASALAIRMVEQSLGAPLSTLFASFDAEPVAAASVAQVHFAVLPDGKKVAVKILRPGVAERFKKDLALFSWLAGVIERRLPHTRRMKPREMVRTLKESFEFELNLTYEAAAAVELKENTKDDAGFYVPEVYWDYTAHNVLTLERIEGICIADIPALLQAGHDVDQLVQYSANAMFSQVFRDGYFHADLHPGNIFVLADGRLAVVDFGIMGRLDRKNRLFLAQVLRGFLIGDFALVARLHVEYGIVPSYKSEEYFALACRAIAGRVLGKPLADISVAQLLGQLFQMSEDFEMQLQPQFLLLQKTLMLAEGVGRMLNSGINMWQLSTPLIEQWGKKHLSRRAFMRYAMEDALHEVKRLPLILSQLEQRLQADQGGQATMPSTMPCAVSTPKAPKRCAGIYWLATVTVVVLAFVTLFSIIMEVR